MLIIDDIENFKGLEQISSMLYLLINKHLEEVIKGRADVILDIGELGGKLSVQHCVDDCSTNPNINPLAL